MSLLLISIKSLWALLRVIACSTNTQWIQIIIIQARVQIALVEGSYAPSAVHLLCLEAMMGNQFFSYIVFLMVYIPFSRKGQVLSNVCYIVKALEAFQNEKQVSGHRQKQQQIKMKRSRDRYLF